MLMPLGHQPLLDLDPVFLHHFGIFLYLFADISIALSVQVQAQIFIYPTFPFVLSQRISLVSTADQCWKQIFLIRIALTLLFFFLVYLYICFHQVLLGLRYIVTLTSQLVAFWPTQYKFKIKTYLRFKPLVTNSWVRYFF